MISLKLSDAHILGMIMAYLLGFFVMPVVIFFIANKIKNGMKKKHNK